MTQDEIREIADIVGGDKTYKRFVKRINREFKIADKDRLSQVFVLYVEDEGEKVGFSVIGFSPAKMKLWAKTLKEEGWVKSDFKMKADPFELMYMYVKPGYREKGVGRKLFKKTISFTKKKKVKEIYAYVSDRSSQAFDFYKDMNAEVLVDLSDEEIKSAFLRWSV
jgi:GNAT superfamily N-acetyltransferase